MIRLFKGICLIFLSINIFCFMGCIHKESLYTQWGKQLSNTGDLRTKEDVSLILGAPPYKCEDIEPEPKIGVLIPNPEVPKIEKVYPNGAAWIAGMQSGEIISSVNGIKMSTSKEANDAIKSSIQFDEKIIIQTNKKIYSLTPKRPKEAKQCYWDISAGTVGQTRGSAYIDRYGGAAGHSGSQYVRFFRATCRFYDGVCMGCRANWQE